MTLCETHATEWAKWVDHYQDAGPVTRYRHYSPSPENRRRMSEEMWRVRIEERRQLIRQQLDLIERDCSRNCTQEGGPWPTSAPTPSSTSDTSTTPR